MKILVFLIYHLLFNTIFGSCIDREVKSYPKLYTQEEKIYALSLCWSEIKFNFVDMDRIGFDIDSLYRVTLDRVLHTDNDVDFYRELDSFFAAFRDGHTEIYRKSFDESDYFEDIPAEISEIDRKYYFTSIKKGTGIDSVLLGAEIVKIEGIPVQEYIRSNYMPYICHFSEDSRWNYAAQKMQTQSVGQDSFRGEARLHDGRTMSFDIPFNYWATQSPRDNYWSLPLPAQQKPFDRVDLSWESGDVAVLTMRYFDSEKTPAQLDSVMPQICDRAKGLVIDLRAGKGGAGDVGWHLRMCIDSSEYFRVAGSQTRTNNGYYRSQGNWQEQYASYYENKAYTTMPADTIYRDTSVLCVSCPVVVLIGMQTGSACEDFLIDLYEVAGRPLFIGERTQGSTGAPYVFYLPHGGVGRVCTRRVLFPYSGQPFLNGISPDIEVKQTIDDLIKGRDPVMEKAIEMVS